jgi:hypothetical protein
VSIQLHRHAGSADYDTFPIHLEAGEQKKYVIPDGECNRPAPVCAGAVLLANTAEMFSALPTSAHEMDRRSEVSSASVVSTKVKLPFPFVGPIPNEPAIG